MLDESVLKDFGVSLDLGKEIFDASCELDATAKVHATEVTLRTYWFCQDKSDDEIEALIDQANADNGLKDHGCISCWIRVEEDGSIREEVKDLESSSARNK